ncbi:MAG: LytTR family DNA-binding domain-containing protein [Burkholderiaceae bacterium]
MTTMPTALIAEDEPLLAAALQAELARAWPGLRVAATVGDGASAVEQALALRPDVLFLDIRMPVMDGLDAAAELAERWDERDAPFPALVFVTAYDQYAVRAFEAQALDYVLKPLRPERLAKTVRRLRASLARGASRKSGNDEGGSTPAGDTTLQATAEQLHRLLAALQPAAAATGAPLRQLPVSVPGSGGASIRMVPIDDVLYLQAADKYVRVVTADGDHLLRTPLKDLLPQLDAGQFWQIHRAILVRADAIDTVQRDEAGRLRLALRGCPEWLAVSRLYAHRFKAM